MPKHNTRTHKKINKLTYGKYAISCNDLNGVKNIPCKYQISELTAFKQFVASLIPAYTFIFPKYLLIYSKITRISKIKNRRVNKSKVKFVKSRQLQVKHKCHRKR